MIDIMGTAVVCQLIDRLGLLDFRQRQDRIDGRRHSDDGIRIAIRRTDIERHVRQATDDPEVIHVGFPHRFRHIPLTSKNLFLFFQIHWMFFDDIRQKRVVEVTVTDIHVEERVLFRDSILDGGQR